MIKLSLAASLLAIATFVNGDWQYRSRPDLAPPILNITIEATKDTDDGYLFIAPYSGFKETSPSHGPRQGVPYIFTDKGELVWSGFGYFAGWPANFQKARIHGKDVIFSLEGNHNPDYGHGHGHWTFLDNHYDQIGILRAGNHKIADKHELIIKDEKTGIVQIHQPTPYDLTELGGEKNQQWIVDSIFQNIDLKTNEVLFEWSALAHVSPHDSVISLQTEHIGGGYNSSDSYDYFHLNSVDKDEDGNYLVSARNVASIYKIDGKTGEIIWKLGGLPNITSSDFELSGWNFSFQHHARFLPRNGSREIISFFDNSGQGSENDKPDTVINDSQSSAKIISVDSKKLEVDLIYVAYSPDRLLAKSQGSTQVLENGNVLVNWGSEGAITEFNKDGEAIFHTYLDSGFLGAEVQNYRAFKFDWVGLPKEPIAVLTEFDKDNKTTAYVSWNGDTETKSWKFYAIDGKDKKLVGEKKRSGFETKIELEDYHEEIVAVSIDKHGKALRSSEVSKIKAQITPASEEPEEKEQAQNYFSWKGLYSIPF